MRTSKRSEAEAQEYQKHANCDFGGDAVCHHASIMDGAAFECNRGSCAGTHETTDVQLSKRKKSPLTFQRWQGAKWVVVQ